MKTLRESATRISRFLSSDSLYSLLLAATLLGLSLALQAHIGLGLGDEGYLWYGAIRTAAGDVPIRDFQAYDPGRYYWSALWMGLFSNGILVLRYAAAGFAGLGLWLGLLALRRVGYSKIAMIPLGCAILAWMVPRYKVFECSLSLIAVFLAMQLVVRPSRKHFVMAGFIVGLTAFFGRNLGLYQFVGFGALILFLHFKVRARLFPSNLFAWLIGIVVGYSPMLLLAALVPGFLESFVESVVYVFIKGSLNITRSVPWPWRLEWSASGLESGFERYFVSSFYVLAPIVYGIALLTGILARKERLENAALLIASGFIGLPYLHHSFSRADWSHMAQSVQPLLLGLAGAASALGLHRNRTVAALGLVAATMLFGAGARYSDYYLSSRYERHDWRVVHGDPLWIPMPIARYVDALRNVYAEHVRPGESLWIAPHSPGAYALLGITSPVREILFLRRQTDEAQRRMISDLEKNNTNWALVANATTDRRDDLEFSSTNRLLWEYLNDNFESSEVPGLPPPMRLYRRHGLDELP